MYALVDCNNFYASCERVFKPHLVSKPVIVLSNNDGCVIARSNESKQLGIKMGEPAFKIKNIIEKNKVHVFSTNFTLYGDMSQRVMNTLSDIIPFIEIYSIDEAFLDLRKFNKKDIPDICSKIKKKILKNTGIPVSIGVGRTKTLSKIANHIAKKDKGICILQKKNEDEVLDDFLVENIWGVGKKLSFFLHSRNIKTAKKLKYLNLIWARSNMTVVGERMIKELRGEECLTLDSSHSDKKSICTSRTFGDMVADFEDLSSSIAMYATRCAEKLRFQKSCAHYAYVFIQTNPYRRDLRQYVQGKIVKFPVATHDTSEILNAIFGGLKDIYKKGYLYKKAGVILGGIIKNHEVQGDLFDDVNRNRNDKIINTVDVINRKMGQDVIRYAALGYRKKWKLKQEKLSSCYTTRWEDLLEIRLK